MVVGNEGPEGWETLAWCIYSISYSVLQLHIQSNALGHAQKIDMLTY